MTAAVVVVVCKVGHGLLQIRRHLVGQEQFVIGKEGTIALRQVLSSPIVKGGGFPVLLVAIGVIVIGIISAVGALVVLMGSGGDNVPIAVAAPTETPAAAESSTETPAETESSTPYPTPAVVPTYTPNPTYTPWPTSTPLPTPVPTYTPRPEPKPTSRPTATVQPGSAITGQNCAAATDGTSVTAWIDGNQVAAGVAAGGDYTLLIAQGEQSFAGKLIRFKIGGVEAHQTITWTEGGAEILNLTVGSSLQTTSTPSSLDTSQFKNWTIGLMTQRVPPHVVVGTATRCPTQTPFPTQSCSDLEGPPNYSIIIDQGDKSFSGRTVSFTVGGYPSGTANWLQGGTSNVDLEALTGLTGLPNSSIRNIPISVSGQRVPPNVFVGTAFLDCELAPVGTSVSAWINGEIVGTSWVEKIKSVSECSQFNRSDSTCVVFADVINNGDNLVAVWKFSNATRSWSFFVPEPEYYGMNNLTTTGAGDIVWVNVNNEQVFQGGTLFPGWNLISLALTQITGIATPTPIPTPTPTTVPTPVPTPTATPVPTPRRLMGQAYIAEDGVEVTLTSLNTTIVGNVTSVTISYTLRNTTEDLKDEDSWKLYYSGGGGLPQYGFFSQMLPGQTINGSYTFNVQSPDVPSVVAYPSRFFAGTWQQGDLIWEID